MKNKEPGRSFIDIYLGFAGPQRRDSVTGSKKYEIWQIREKRRVLQFFAYFFFKFTRLLSIENKYIYIFEKINQWLFKFLEAKNSQKSLKFYKFTKKRRVLQSFAYFFFQIYQIVKQGKLICLYFRKKKIRDYSNFYKQKTPKNPWNSTNSRKNDEFYNF